MSLIAVFGLVTCNFAHLETILLIPHCKTAQALPDVWITFFKFCPRLISFRGCCPATLRCLSASAHSPFAELCRAWLHASDSALPFTVVQICGQRTHLKLKGLPQKMQFEATDLNCPSHSMIFLPPCFVIGIICWSWFAVVVFFDTYIYDCNRL